MSNKENNETVTTKDDEVTLTLPQIKLMLCLMQMINNKDVLKGKPMPDPDKFVILPELNFTLYDIAKLYTGGKKYVNDTALKQVMDIINTLNEKKFLTVYREMRQIKRGKKIESVRHERRCFHDFLKVVGIKVPKNIINNILADPKDGKTNYFEAFIKEFSKSKNMVTNAKEVIITLSLNPIFSSQLDSSYVLFPENFIDRLNTANGHGNIPNITTKLVLYLMLQKAFTKPFEISLENLRWMVAEKFMGESRIKEVNTGLEKAYKTATTMGLLKGLEVNQSTGVASFFLDKNFHKKQSSFKKWKNIFD